MAFGITLLPWKENFLSGRTYYVSINNLNSEQLNVLISMPQGTVLRPILFLIYVNDTPLDVDKRVILKLFADDSKVHKMI